MVITTSDEYNDLLARIEKQQEQIGMLRLEVKVCKANYEKLLTLCSTIIADMSLGVRKRQLGTMF